MAAPTVTSNQSGIASGSLAASGTTSFNLDIKTKFEARLQVKNTGGGTVAGTNGVQVDVFRYVDGSTSNPDTVSIRSFVIPTTVSVTKYRSLALPTGHYKILLTNLDTTNAVTVSVIFETTDAVS
jgi:hypothetical protein